jgi:hypothetical protein
MDVDLRDLMVDIYGVNYPWLAGEVPLHDYASIDKMNGADKLVFKDRDDLAMFAASMPRDGRSYMERLADIAANRERGRVRRK